MKTFQKGLFALLLLCSTIITVSAQPGTVGTIKTDGEGTGGSILELHPTECSVKIPIRIMLTNLYPNLQEDGYSIPQHIPDMFLEYQLVHGDEERIIEDPVIVPLSGVNFNYFKHYEGVPIFETIIDSEVVNIESYCRNGANEFTYVNVLTRLVTLPSEVRGDEASSRSIYIPYPACNYSGRYEIFSCAVFKFAGDCNDGLGGQDELIVEIDDETLIHQETERLTEQSRNGDEVTSNAGPDDGSEGCLNDGLVRKVLGFKVLCPAICQSDPGPGDDPNDGPSDEPDTSIGDYFLQQDTEIQSNLLETVAVYPNPVQHTMQVQWSAEESLEGLNLYQSNGSLIRSWSKQQLEATNSLDIPVEELSKGLYFLEAKSAMTTKVLKVVKQ